MLRRCRNFNFLKMKYLIITLLFSINSFSQFELDYTNIQTKFGVNNVDNTFVQTKITKNLDTITFTFSMKDSLLLNVYIRNNNGIVKKDKDQLIEDFFKNFTAIKTKSFAD